MSRPSERRRPQRPDQRLLALWIAKISAASSKRMTSSVWQRPVDAPKSGRQRPLVAQFRSPSKRGKFPKDSLLCDRLCVMARTVPTALAALFILSSAALGQNVPRPDDRFALYNDCAPMGLVHRVAAGRRGWYRPCSSATKSSGGESIACHRSARVRCLDVSACGCE